MDLAIINYGMGNLQSVSNAFQCLGITSSIVNHPDELRQARRIVLPGVGAFGDGIRQLRNGNWVEALEEEVRNKSKPFLGLCLGMQLLATSGTEYGAHAGLNWIPGSVERIKNLEQNIRIPHMGWNDVRVLKSDGLYKDVEDRAFYFVHSYVLQPTDYSVVSAVCNYGSEFAASIENGNIHATQFHPEKSHQSGLKLLENFIRLPH